MSYFKDHRKSKVVNDAIVSRVVGELIHDGVSRISRVEIEATYGSIRKIRESLYAMFRSIGVKEDVETEYEIGRDVLIIRLKKKGGEIE